MQTSDDRIEIARLIFNSQAYQRQPTAEEGKAHLFAAPLRRRMTAEQVLDSLLAAAGKEAHTEEMNVDVDSSRLETSSINLGLPTRAWRFTTMGNERDRPSLSLPAAQTAVTLLETFGWRSTRQDPLTYREKEPTVLQPAMERSRSGKLWPRSAWGAEASAIRSSILATARKQGRNLLDAFRAVAGPSPLQAVATPPDLYVGS